MPVLPGDVARCPGIGSESEGWDEDCETCARRTCPPTNHPQQAWMRPPAVIVFGCPFYKGSDDEQAKADAVVSSEHAA